VSPIPVLTSLKWSNLVHAMNDATPVPNYQQSESCFWIFICRKQMS